MGYTMDKNNKGFTLAELLIVVAIVGVLVAISIPIFSGKLVKAQIATNQANYRSAKAAAIADYLVGGEYGEKAGESYYYCYEVEEGKLEKDEYAPASYGSGNSDVTTPLGVIGSYYIEVNDDGVGVVPTLDFISDPKNY